MSLSFLEASKIATAKNNFPKKNFILATSCQTEKLDVFIKASSILKGFQSEYTVLPFNTLQQYLSSSDNIQTTHIFIIFPWDIIPEADWRTGIASTDLSINTTRDRITKFLSLIDKFLDKRFIYIPAKILPVNLNFNINQQIELQLNQSFLKYHAKIISPDSFSLSSYLSNGSAFSSKHLSKVATEIIDFIAKSTATKKILITDLDNVMWNGVVSEDGLNKISCDAESAGYVHYIYQSLLVKLKSQGILIAAVTRNDKATALSPFHANKTIFKANDFVTVIASYNAKSSQIRNILKQLNLPEDSAVFVDDNPIELEEVQSQLTAINCIAFPAKNELFPSLIEKLQIYFNIQTVTEEDKSRTELYKSRHKAIEISTEKGADLTEYLLSLKMQLTIQHSNKSNLQRSLQLLNKTNQFNLNGKRLTDLQLDNILNNGNTLYTFSLEDKFGAHGQIACLIISHKNHIPYFVMSCRVFQRKIENIIIYWLVNNLKLTKLTFNFMRTDKNIPFQKFINNDYFTRENNNPLSLDIEKFLSENKNMSDIISLVEK